MGVGQVWADAITTADMNLGDADVTIDFESLSTTTLNASSSAAYYSPTGTNLTGFTPFEYAYMGSNGNGAQSFAVASSSGSMTSNHLAFSVTNNGAAMSFGYDFSEKGAISFKVLKTSKIYIGIYDSQANSATIFTHTSAAVMLHNNGSKAQLSAGRTSSTPQKWQDVTSTLPSTDVLEYLIVYNNTNEDDTYGDNITIPAYRAHVYINGDAVMSGDNPLALYLNGNDMAAFYICYQGADKGVVCASKIDDIKIYDALPTESCTNKITWSDPTKTGTGTLTFDKSSGVATCDGGNTLQATVTPGQGFKCTALSFSVSDGTVDIDPEIVTTELPVYPSSAQYDLTFAEDQSATLSASVTFTAFTDQFKDIMHGNSISNKSGNYGGMPAALSDETPGDDYCSEKHYKFAGWVVESDIDLDTGRLKDGATIVPAGDTGHYATGVTWYAVWAKENEVE